MTDIDGIESVRLLAIKFGRMPAELRVVLRPKLLDAARVVARQAQANASWSSRIPAATKPGASVSSKGGGLVRVNRNAAPHARPYEGIEGNSVFRHPVFGRDTWVEQATRPFLMPALREKQAEAVGLVEDAVRTVNRSI